MNKSRWIPSLVAINALGVVTGYGLVEGFIRQRNGQFAPSVVVPSSQTNGGATLALDLNSSANVAGFYTDADDGTAHGFLFNGSAFSYFDVPGALSTLIYGINDNGYFVGQYRTNPNAYIYKGFTNIGGTLAPLDIPDAFNSTAQAISSSGVIAGYYTDKPNDLEHHGFILDEAGTLTAPIDFPGASRLGGTIFHGINAFGWAVGGFYDQNQVEHGLLFRLPDSFLTYSYPGATLTVINGINDQGLICGDYVDTDGVRHGFLGRIR